MNPVSISATSLKNNTAHTLSSVYYGGTTYNIMRHGKVVATIIPPKNKTTTDSKKALSDKLNKYYGAALDFPIVERRKSSRNISFDV